MYPNASIKEFKVNDFLKLKLVSGRTHIYVRNRCFTQCMYLLLNIPVDKIRQYDQIDSIDEAAEVLDRSMEGGRNWQRITAEEEFQGHCSNIQAWYENDYDTRILHRNLAFPLLKKLTDAGDQLAKNRFKEEIALRYSSGHNTVMTYLLHNGYLKYLDKEELECLLDDNQLPYLKSLARDFDRTFKGFNSMIVHINKKKDELDGVKEQYLYPRLNSLLERTKRYLGIQNIPFVLSNVVKKASEKNKKDLVHFIIEKYKENRKFPLIEFLNNNLEFINGELDTVNYNNSIVGLLNQTNLFLRDKNIKNIFEIELPNDEYSEIKAIDLSRNIIQGVKGIEDFKKLQVLKLNNNKIKKMEGFDNLTELRHLSLRNNNISRIEGIEDLKNLETIDLSGNRDIEEIPDFLIDLPRIRSIKLLNCTIKRFSEKVSKFFWNDQNYRFYSNWTEEDVEYYESHYSNRKAHTNNQLYKDFTRWLLKTHSLMNNYGFNYQDLKLFEDESEKKSIWSGKPTKDFLDWIYNKPQTKLSDFC